jgi:hypothetical protein
MLLVLTQWKVPLFTIAHRTTISSSLPVSAVVMMLHALQKARSTGSTFVALRQLRDRTLMPGAFRALLVVVLRCWRAMELLMDPVDSMFIPILLSS